MAIEVIKKSEQVTIEPDKKLGYRGNLNTEGAMGKANATALTSIFKGSPLPGYSPTNIKVGGEKDDIDTSDAAAYRKWFMSNVVKGKISDEAYGLGQFHLDYNDEATNLPDMNGVKTGAAGLPATPFVPNPVSPGEGSVNPSTMAAAPEGFVNKQTPSAPFSGASVSLPSDGTKAEPARNPTNTAKQIKDRL